MNGTPDSGKHLARLQAATARLQAGKLAEGIALLEALVAELDGPQGPGDAGFLAGVLKNLAIGRLQSGATVQALETLRRVAVLAPFDAECRHALAALLMGQGWANEALPHARAAAEAFGNAPEAWLTLGKALEGCGDFTGARVALDRALALDSGHLGAMEAQARICAELGLMAELRRLLDQLSARVPGHPEAASARLAAMHYDPSKTPEAIAEAHVEWGRALAGVAGEVARPAIQDPDPERVLRVGYLSADFRGHSCAHFIEPLFRAHDRRAVHLAAFHAAPRGDARTETLKGLVDTWHSVHGLADADLAALIREARIDILVELGGHTAHSRLRALALRPAPLQLSWLGYPAATGLPAVDGRISDSRVEPSGAGFPGLERVLLLDRAYLCWMPPAAAPAPFDSGGGRDGPFTFGSFNHFAKLNGAVVDAWAAILRRVPGSRLLLKARGTQNTDVRERLLGHFEECGVPAGRLEFMDFSATAEDHLAAYGRIDLALDPFPYNGVTTTFEALWMGVPVLTLKGQASLGRQGAAILGLLGLDDLVATDGTDYVERAAALACDPARLVLLRKGLRERLASSPYCDAEGYARRMEGLYRGLWRELCAGREPRR